MTDVLELTTSQEEADTKVFVYCAHARYDGFSSVCIFTVDSDVPLYALYFKEHIGMDIYVEIGVKNTRRHFCNLQFSWTFCFNCNYCTPLLHRK